MTGGGAALLAAGCQRTPAAPRSAPAPGLQVALLSPGPISDQGWNAAAYEGLLRIQKELHAHTSQKQTHGGAEFEADFRHYAAGGYRLVFGHGDELNEPAMRVAPEFPNTVFVTTGGRQFRENVAPMLFTTEEATYLLGMLAASLSRTGKAGQVGGLKLPPVERAFRAFENGAHAVNPRFSVRTVYINSWDDVSAAKEATLALIAQGADAINHNADAAGLGVFQAVQSRGGVLAFGANKDQAAAAPDVIVASAVLDIPRAFVEMAQRVQAGHFQGRVYPLGMKEGVVSLAYNPRLAGRIPAAARARVEKARRAILAGTLTVTR